MKKGKYLTHALMLWCYGATVSHTAKGSRLGLRRTKVLLKQLRAGTTDNYTDFRGRNYRGYLIC